MVTRCSYKLSLHPPTPNHVPVVLFKYTADGLTLKASDKQDWDDSSYYESEEGFTVREAIEKYKSYIPSSYIEDSSPQFNRQKLKIFWEKRQGKLWQIKVIPLDFLNNAIYPVRLDTTTNYDVGSGDGHIQSPWKAAWDDAHDHNGAQATVGGSELKCHSSNWGTFAIGRGVIPIDTSGIPDAATISAATLYLYTEGAEHGDTVSPDDGYGWVSVVQANLADPTIDPPKTDFDDLPDTNPNPTEACDSGDRLDISSFSDNTWYNIPFNATGIGWINKTGYTELAIREGHDIVDTPGNINSNGEFAYVEFQYSGDANNPYLAVTYTEGGVTRMIPQVIFIQ